jgi:soluble lytic murein transglycosylase-like protein
VIRPEELKGKNDLERANLVWARYGYLIRSTAAEYDLDPNLIFATIMVESGGNTYAVRQEPRIHDASYGLGQLLYGTARGIGYRGTPEGLFDPAVNIDLIGRYHKRNFDHYNDLGPKELTVAYNTGSPYKKPHPGHLTKFDKWYNSLANLEVDLS